MNDNAINNKENNTETPNNDIKNLNQISEQIPNQQSIDSSVENLESVQVPNQQVINSSVENLESVQVPNQQVINSSVENLESAQFPSQQSIDSSVENLESAQFPSQQNNSTTNLNHQKKKTNIIKILAIIGGIILGIIIIIAIFITIVFTNHNKFVCESSIGDITLTYNNKEITGYIGNGISYDLDEQQQISKQIGVQNYLDKFNEWFKANTGGSCSVKKK